MTVKKETLVLWKTLLEREYNHNTQRLSIVSQGAALLVGFMAGLLADPTKLTNAIGIVIFSIIAIFFVPKALDNVFNNSKGLHESIQLATMAIHDYDMITTDDNFKSNLDIIEEKIRNELRKHKSINSYM